MERLDLTASRNETWQPTIDYVYSGDPLPLDGATLRMQWRLFEGAPGLPLIDRNAFLTLVLVATTEDVALGVARPGDNILRMLPVITADELNALPSGLNQPEPGDADRYVWDVVINYTDEVIDRFLGGYVYLAKGVTNA